MARHRILRGVLAVAAVASALLVTPAGPAHAASSKGCVNGSFKLINLTTGVTVATGGKDRIRTTIPATSLGDRFAVRGRYAQFDVRASDFAVLDQAFTGAANELDLTGGRFTPVFASKVPDLRGSSLTSGIAIELRDEDLSLQRTAVGSR